MSVNEIYIRHLYRWINYTIIDKMQLRLNDTVESRFLEPPRETKIGSRNREFERSKVASNVAKLLRYCFIRGNRAHFRSNRWEMSLAV